MSIFCPSLRPGFFEKCGGEPVGFIRVIGEPGTLILESRPLHEYADDSSIAAYLSSLCDAVGNNLQELSR